jgi:3-deoxy-D-manno-octulosonate 8-phosphate phosphatase (KDO 8-P phosphatase)
MKGVSKDIDAKAGNIRLLLLDVDGVLTDGSITYSDEGIEEKTFNVRDGHGIKLLKRGGVECGIITSRSSGALLRRCEDLGLELVSQGAKDKALAFEEMLEKTTGCLDGISPAEVAYVGDDLVDIPVLRRVGLAIAVSDAAAELTEVVDYTTKARGGRGAVREVAELILKARGSWDELVAPYLEA